jgi:hypothetical protein
MIHDKVSPVGQTFLSAATRGRQECLPHRSPWFVCVLCVWIMALAASFAFLERYATTPGGAGAAVKNWPIGTVLVPDPERANLVLLAHPRCPCTRASMDELERLAARCRGLVAIHVLFYRPGTSANDWAKTDLWERAAAIPDAQVRADTDGTEAARFGAATSGQVLLYDRDGRLLFSGGITNARGHAGASMGADAILAGLTTGNPGRKETPVYGCPLAGADLPEE